MFNVNMIFSAMANYKMLIKNGSLPENYTAQT